jgi:glyoxylate/hydroxypyruvate reductase A
MSLVVNIVGWETDPWVEAFAAMLPGRDVATPENVSSPDKVLYAATWKHAPGSLSIYPNLRAVFSLGAGVDHVFRDPQLPDVPVVRVVDPDLRDRMSEWVLLHVLMHHRQQRMYDWQQGEKIWADDRFQPAARDVRVGVMGMGILGRDAARKLALVGFDVAGWSRSRKQVDGVESFAGEQELDAFLARTDVLVVLLPLTPDTRGILDASLFAKLARDGRLGGPVLLNAGRGGLQVEADILAALDEGVLRAATLDVFEEEPLPQDSRLWTHPQVTITPHNAAISEVNAVARCIVNGIEALERGEIPSGTVDRSRQY